MRSIYLLRHGKPDFCGGNKLCIGKSDLSLSPVGCMQSYLMKEALDGFGRPQIYSSGMLRANQTAGLISSGYKYAPRFTELDMGEWEGLEFSEIKAKWPKLYEKRGINPAAVTVPGGESFEEGAERVFKAFTELALDTRGNIAIVAHAGVNRLLLCRLGGVPLCRAFSFKQPYGCINIIEEIKQGFNVVQIGEIPAPVFSKNGCMSLLNAAKTPSAVIEHCIAVAEVAVEICCKAPRADKELVFRSALLHDIARNMPGHAETGAKWLMECGYSKEAETVASHNNLPDNGASLEAKIVFLADKLVDGTKRVTIDERFKKSAKKCVTAESKEAHGRRYTQVMKIMKELL